MLIDPFEVGEFTPRWRTQYMLGGLEFKFDSFSDDMSEHITKWNKSKQDRALVLKTGMVFTRAGHLIWD